MDAEKIAELRRLEAAATPGPWELKQDSADGKAEAWGYWHKIGPVSLMGLGPDSNSAMLLAARNALPALLTAAERVAELERRLASLRQIASDYKHHALQAGFDWEDGESDPTFYDNATEEMRLAAECARKLIAAASATETVAEADQQAAKLLAAARKPRGKDG